MVYAAWGAVTGESEPVGAAARHTLGSPSLFVSQAITLLFQVGQRPCFFGQAYESDLVVESYRRRALHALTQNGAQLLNFPYTNCQPAAFQHALLVPKLSKCSVFSAFELFSISEY